MEQAAPADALSSDHDDAGIVARGNGIQLLGRTTATFHVAHVEPPSRRDRRLFADAPD
jgi:hypothetical protein